MNDLGATVAIFVLAGVGGSLAMDVWALFLKTLGISSLDYRLVGRWVGHLRRGRFRHESIASAPAVEGERFVGYLTHYVIGVVFAMVLLAVAGRDWADHPTLAPAVTVGLATVFAPWLVMQPAFGMGIAASKLPGRWRLRVLSVATHVVFGVGMFVTALLASSFLQ